MKVTETNETQSLSLSKQRKIQRKKDIIKMKKDALIERIVWSAIIVVIIAAVFALIGFGIYRGATKVTASSDYSAQLTEDGLIKDVTATNYITLADYKKLSVASSELEYSDESVESDITTLLADYDELSTTTTAVIADGDKINVDFVGTIDGVEFSNGSTNGEGTDITIGTTSMIDDFTDQLIGHVVGDVFNIEVTFPDDYSNDASLAGKDAVFATTINGIYVTPEFNDEFVATYLFDTASTADEYRAYIKETKFQSNLSSWIQETLLADSTAKNYPNAYINQLKALHKYEENAYYESLNSYYYNYLGYYPYASFQAYTEMSETKYDASLREKVLSQAKEILIYQAIAELEGIKASEEDYLAYVISQGQTEDNYNSYLTTYGKGYLMQQDIARKVIEYVKTLVTIQ